MVWAQRLQVAPLAAGRSARPRSGPEAVVAPLSSAVMGSRSWVPVGQEARRSGFEVPLVLQVPTAQLVAERYAARSGSRVGSMSERIDEHFAMVMVLAACGQISMDCSKALVLE